MRPSKLFFGLRIREVGLISPELYERVWRIIREAEPVTVDAKFEEHLSAFQVKSLWTG